MYHGSHLGGAESDRPEPIRAARPYSPDLARRPMRLLFVSRLAVRKGLDLVIGLSHRLSDLIGRVQIEIIGDQEPVVGLPTAPLRSQPRSRRLCGPTGPEQPRRGLHGRGRADPAEQISAICLDCWGGLASGLPVVASDEVGAAEGIDARCCAIFRSGDLDEFESAVRGLIGRLENGARPAISQLARSEAQRHFSSEHIAARVAESLEETLSGGCAR